MIDVDGIIERWPKSWAGMKEDVVFGEKLLVELKPFVEFLVAKGYAKRTMERHLGNLRGLGQRPGSVRLNRYFGDFLCFWWPTKLKFHPPSPETMAGQEG